MLKPLKRKSLAASVYEQLRDHIVHGEFSPGDELPAERTLSEQLQVNRSAVREGLKRLEQAGLVAIQQGEATKILDFKKNGGLNILTTLILRPNGTINTGVVRSVLDMRTSMATEVAKLCALSSSATNLENMDKLLTLMQTHRENLRELQDLTMRYWGAVVAGTDNIAYQLAYNSLDTTYRSIEGQLTYILADELSCLEDYQALRDCIQARESEQAGQWASRIVVRGQQAILGVLATLDAEKEQPL
jgi:GntR family transcriptional repressor for pyruvate dehydrogenase complex